MHSFRLVIALSVSTVLSAGVVAQDRAAPLAGKWRGEVTTDIGTMAIGLTVTVTTGVATGQVESAHGAFKISAGKFADGKWTLPFETDEGGSGKMIGVVKGDTFSGEWDFRPMAVGTFALSRLKTNERLTTAGR